MYKRKLVCHILVVAYIVYLTNSENVKNYFEVSALSFSNEVFERNLIKNPGKDTFLLPFRSKYWTMVEIYGKFVLKIGKFNLCKGPKRYDCTNITSSIENETTIKMDMYIKENVIPNQGKVIAMANGKPLIRLQMKNPCDHFFMRPLFQALLNVTQKCEFKKGHHIINIDIQDVAQKYYGGNFFYGNVSFKAVFYNEHCNFSCAIIEVTFVPVK